MPNFHYQATDAAGQTITGELEAESIQHAAAQLENHGLTVQSIGFSPSAPEQPEVGSTPIRRLADRSSDGKSSSAGESVEQAVLRSHMATILDRGRVIAPALKAYAEDMPVGRPRRQLLDVCRILESGDAAQGAAALATLPECWIPLLGAATSSSDPDDLLREFLTESQRMDDLRHQWWLTLAYPFVLLCLTTAVLALLSIFVIPEFRGIFAEFNLQLPGLTRVVLTLATWFSGWGGVLAVILLVALAVTLLNASRLLPVSKFAWLGDRFRPPFGRRAAVARFVRFTADLLEANLSAPDALRIAGFAVHQSQLQQAAWGLANELESSGGISACDDAHQLTATVLHALKAPMPLATRVRLLREISSCHADRVRIVLSWATGIVEPLAICMVGCAVGLVVIALFLPLVKLIDALTG